MRVDLEGHAGPTRQGVFQDEVQGLDLGQFVPVHARHAQAREMGLDPLGGQFLHQQRVRRGREGDEDGRADSYRGRDPAPPLAACLCTGRGAGELFAQAGEIRGEFHHPVYGLWGEARRCVSELGAVGVIGTPNPVNGQHLHDEACDPLWSALEELDVPIGFHPTGNTSLKDDAGRRYVGHANFHPIAHAIRNPVELMGAIASMTTGGILERHPRLRCAFLEGTAGWLHWWLWRLDDQWEKFGPGCEHQLTLNPSEYFKRQCYIALDVDEEPAVDVVNKMGADYFVVSTDYPHSDGAFPEAMEQFFGLPFSDEVRRKILWENCARLYNISGISTNG